MKIKREESGAVSILRLSGTLMGGPDADEFKKQIHGLVSEGRKQVLIDMSKISWVNSTGLGILIAGHHTMKKAEGVMKLVGTSERIDQIFMVTKLNTIFESFEDETNAIASF